MMMFGQRLSALVVRALWILTGISQCDDCPSFPPPTSSIKGGSRSRGTLLLQHKTTEAPQVTLPDVPQPSAPKQSSAPIGSELEAESELFDEELATDALQPVVPAAVGKASTPASPVLILAPQVTAPLNFDATKPTAAAALGPASASPVLILSPQVTAPLRSYATTPIPVAALGTRTWSSRGSVPAGDQAPALAAKRTEMLGSVRALLSRANELEDYAKEHRAVSQSQLHDNQIQVQAMKGDIALPILLLLGFFMLGICTWSCSSAGSDSCGQTIWSTCVAFLLATIFVASGMLATTEASVFRHGRWDAFATSFATVAILLFLALCGMDALRLCGKCGSAKSSLQRRTSFERRPRRVAFAAEVPEQMAAQSGSSSS